MARFVCCVLLLHCSASHPVEEQPIGAPIVTSFSASTSSVALGASVMLSWTLAGGAPAALTVSPDVGSVFGRASALVSVNANTTYTITATNASGTATASVTVTLIVESLAPPVIDSFAATPNAIASGCASRLNWSVTNATAITISSVGDQALTATATTISPSVDTTYVLSATGPGGTSMATTLVSVAAPAATVTESIFADAFASAWNDTHSSAPVSTVAVQGMGNAVTVTSAGQGTALAFAHVKANGDLDPVAAGTYNTFDFVALGPGVVQLTTDNGSVGVVITLGAAWAAYSVPLEQIDSSGGSYGEIEIQATQAGQSFSVENVELEKRPTPPTCALQLVHFVGRFDTSQPGGPLFGFPGSAISAHFSGTGIGVTLEDQGANQFDVIVDNGAPTLLKTSGAVTATLANGLSAGEHDVTLIKRTESNQGIVQFQGFLPTGGVLIPVAAPSTRRIEMIGDSITCGYGDIGDTFYGESNACTFSADTEDEGVAWGAIAANQLQAVHTAIAYSGKGVYENYANRTGGLLPDVWHRTLADDSGSTWDVSQYTPDVVVLNAGTNDYWQGDPGAPFETAYIAFLHSIRTAYPNAYIVCTTGPMISDPSFATHVGHAITAVGDAKISHLDLGDLECASLSDTQCGCDSHPNAARQFTMATALVTHLHTLLGW